MAFDPEVQDRHRVAGVVTVALAEVSNDTGEPGTFALRRPRPALNRRRVGRRRSGRLTLGDVDISRVPVRDMVRLGIGYVPEGRHVSPA